MKILYAIQGTGNGHITRAQVFIPLLQKHGEVDVLVSSIDHDLALPIQAKFKINGLGFIFGKKGGINYWKSFWRFKIIRFLIDMYRFPIDDYDLIVNDFEPLTAWKCALKKKHIIGLSHHGAYLSKKVPRPQNKDWFTEMVLKYHSTCNRNFSFHFQAYDQDIFTPIIRQEIRSGEVKTTNRIVVYVPSISAENLIPYLEKFPEFKFIIFCKHTQKPYQTANAEVHHIEQKKYIHELLSSFAVICNSGFESPSEAIFLGKKLMCITMKGQYEQRCNAAALKQMGIYVIDKFDKDFGKHLEDWFQNPSIIQHQFPDISEQMIDMVLAAK